MKYYIEERNPAEGKYKALSKARSDIMTIAKEQGYKSIIVETGLYKEEEELNSVQKKIGLLRYINRNYHEWKKALSRVKFGDTVLFQYPPLYWTVIGKITRDLKKKGVKTIAVVHDMDSLRWGSNRKFIKKYSYYEDVFGLKQIEKIIVHNSEMKAKMCSMNFSNKNMISLCMFDYIWDYKEYENIREDRFKKDLPVVIAGNLAEEKAEYIYRFKEKTAVKYNLYGSQLDKTILENIDYNYKGTVSPNELPGKIEGSFGLVWDGTSTNMCRGEYGEYLRINNPHKFSLYMAAGIPVIIWNQAALAGFVEKYGLGFTVNSLEEISDKINEISDDEYEKMKKNVSRFSKKVREGYFLKRALKKAEQQ